MGQVPGKDIGQFCFFPAEGGEGQSKPIATALMLGKTPRNRMCEVTLSHGHHLQSPEEWGSPDSLGWLCWQPCPHWGQRKRGVSAAKGISAATFLI